MNKKNGRPTDYTEELADEICEEISSHGVGLRVLCRKNPHWPVREVIYRWLRKYPSFSHRYAQAKLAQVEVFVDDIIEISDDDSNDTIINDQGKEVCNSEWIGRSRLRVDTRKWLASKLAPKIYGTKGIEVGVEGSLLEKIIDKL